MRPSTRPQKKKITLNSFALIRYVFIKTPDQALFKLFFSLFKPQQSNGENVEEEERSQRIEDFDNAMQNYVEILFGVRNCSNFAANCFIKLYSKDKKKFMDTLKHHIENCNENFRGKIASLFQ
uniref:Uncharacterized protein n=1 Tax=Clytia hemisphaerica TaxID=252671 RepID=A0A7M5UEM5_9CNID|eukprot:TCONS_00042936-protein